MLPYCLTTSSRLFMVAVKSINIFFLDLLVQELIFLKNHWLKVLYVLMEIEWSVSLFSISSALNIFLYSSMPVVGKP